jgi:signal transduction histidine kinase
MSMRARIRRFRFPLAVVLIGLAATAVAAILTSRAIGAVDELRFELAVDGLHDSIRARLETYIALLRAGAGVAVGPDGLTAAEFKAFTDGLELRRWYPGIQGIGYTARIAPDRLAAVLDARRREGDPGFEVWPPEPRDEFHAILYLAPLDRRNQQAIGYDMFTEETRRAAMIRARDTGEPALSGMVELVQEIDDDKQPGFLIYVPVYGGAGVPPTIAARRDRLRGFVYSPFRAGDLFDGILGRGRNVRIGFSLFDGDPGAGRLLFETPGGSAGSRFQTARRLEIAGRQWTTTIFSTEAFERSSTMGLARWVIWGGAAVSCLLGWVAWLQTRARERAEMFRARAEQAVRHLRAAERSLQEQAQSAERANRVKDEFLSTLSHELRTPLNAILGWAHMLTEIEMTDDQRRQAVSVILRNAQVQTKLVEDLLDMSRIVSGRLRLDMQPVDLGEVVTAAIDVVRPTAEAKRIVVRTLFGPETGHVRGDAARLQQVVWNLLTNAIKFTPAGGVITVGIERSGEQVEITVADTGTGIPAAFLPHVFERFRQGGHGGDRSQGGLGIGLSIARNLVEMHAGSIRAHSAGENAGATFTIVLPAGRADAVVPEPVG